MHYYINSALCNLPTFILPGSDITGTPLNCGNLILFVVTYSQLMLDTVASIPMILMVFSIARMFVPFDCFTQYVEFIVAATLT